MKTIQINGVELFEGHKFDQAFSVFSAAARTATEAGHHRHAPHAIAHDAAMKCAAYALASKLLIASRAATSAAKSHAKATVFAADALASPPSTQHALHAAAAAEPARLGRHLAALPLSQSHRITALRFAATWNARADNPKTAGGMFAMLMDKAPTADVKQSLAARVLACAKHAQHTSVDRSVPPWEDAKAVCAGSLRPLTPTDVRVTKGCGRCGSLHAPELKALHCVVCGSVL